MQTVLSLLLCLLPACLMAQITLPWDTAYVDVQEYVINRSDSVYGSDHSFRGPGPYTVHFEAEIDPAIHTYYVWQIAKDTQFSEIETQYHELNIDYDFYETGTYYARFVTSNADDTDSHEGEPYSIQVTESELLVPNLITPDSPTGSNEVFLVKYKSLRSFELWVYNRWGKELFHTKDPAVGWDATHDGQPVPTGAYFYLIKAEGTDGIKYNRKGDINVLRTKPVNHS